MNILIAGVGNLLRADDGFGIRVLKLVEKSDRLPRGVKIYEAGIAGIALVQELMDGYDALIIIDAIERAAQPGTLFVVEPLPPAPDVLDGLDVHQSLVDAHYADPSKALLLARALKVCPLHVFIVGCQPESCDEAVEELTPSVERAVPLAAERVIELARELMEADARLVATR